MVCATVLLVNATPSNAMTSQQSPQGRVVVLLATCSTTKQPGGIIAGGVIAGIVVAAVVFAALAAVAARKAYLYMQLRGGPMGAAQGNPLYTPSAAHGENPLYG